MRTHHLCRPFSLGVCSSIAAAALAIACGGEDTNLPPPPPPPPPPPSSLPAPSATPAADVDAAAPAPAAPVTPPTLTEGTPSPDPTMPTPTVKITAPGNNQVLKADKAPDAEVKLDVKNWQTATGSSHVHLILDNKPYKPIYDPKKAVKLSELLGGAALDEGQHVLVAFPSRANHESVKTKGALYLTEFWVGKKGQPTTDLKKPMLIYSRPKGEYKGDMASHVLIDFQVANDSLGDGRDHVTVAVTGPGIADKLTANVTKFGTPYYLDNLQDGEYTVKLDLVDKGGNPVPGPWNSTTRTIKINHAAQADAMPGMAMPSAAMPSVAPASSVAPAPSAAPTTPSK
jgi:hypothetical protein